MATGIRQTFTMKITDDANRVVASGGSSPVGDEESEFSVEVPGSGNNVVDIVVDVSRVLSYYIVATGALTMTVNDDGSPDLTVALVANQPYWWYTGLGANPFAVDVTSIKFTNGGTGAVTVHGAFLANA